MIEGLMLCRHNIAQERIAKEGTALELLASGEGTEITRQIIQKGRHFYLRSRDDWVGFELIYVLQGRLALMDPDEGNIELATNEYLYHHGLPNKVYFRAETEVSLLMLSSSPSFHLGQSEIQDMVSIAKSVEEKDRETEGHCRRLEDLAVMIGERLGLKEQQLIDLSYGAFLHDVGKVHVRDEVLDKTEALTEAEWDEMRKHPDYGAEMLREKDLLRGAAEIVRAHHERYDGKGYPRGLKGEEIPIGARIVAVADAYDAMISVRPYQKGQAKRAALQELRRASGTQFDPEVVRVFVDAIGGEVGAEDTDTTP